MKKLKVKVRETIYEKGNNTNPSLRCLSIYAAKRANFKDFLELGTDVQGSQAISDSQLEVFKADTLSSAFADRIRGYQHLIDKTIREQIAEGEGNMVHEHDGEIKALHYYKKFTSADTIPKCRGHTANYLRAEYEAALGPDADEDFFEFTARYKDLTRDYLQNYSASFTCEAGFLVALNQAGLLADAAHFDEFYKLHEFVDSFIHEANAKLILDLQYAPNP